MVIQDGKKRVILENVKPSVDNGKYPIKRVPGESVTVLADVFADGHDELAVVLKYKPVAQAAWNEAPMRHLGNDRWEAEFTVDEQSIYLYQVTGWIDAYASWRKGIRKKLDAGQDVAIDIKAGLELIMQAVKRAGGADAQRLGDLASQIDSMQDVARATLQATSDEVGLLMDQYPDRTSATAGNEFMVTVEPQLALYSTWYELFPRSCTDDPSRHGTFKDCEIQLTRIAGMGFNVVYFPPIHPIGRKNRKGRNNAVVSQPGDPGSPWAIGSEKGGHKSVNPHLGTMQDFEDLVAAARKLNIEIALDLAYQCAPDHPYVSEHPEWFRKRPDGSIQYAENPPKKYEDIVPFDFECDDWQAMWRELKSIVDFWIGKGIRVFRVDNPHTKAMRFWEWMIASVKKEHPEVLFLAEAFTRPKLMQHLAKIGFSQSYTYFTWRNAKWELEHYLTELTRSDLRDYFRPNFWPNTPDILPEFIQYGGRPAFVLRLALAATLASNYGIYGPAYELCQREAIPNKEEYADSEKYEIIKWDWNRQDSLSDFITRINQIRAENPALQTTWNVRFFETDNEFLLFYAKATPDLSNVVFVIANLDPFHTQSGWVSVPFEELNIPHNQTCLVHDLISDNKYIWQSSRNYIELEPAKLPVHIFKVNRRLKREHDFDYYF
ncbi:MAG: DUF3416 domain-containing protein [Chitinivibrionales bacterium]|nr:DUF3416 domain-containing protein [Chitinivibrionales bacterium]